MPQVKALIVSGDEPARQTLRTTLLGTGDIDVVGEADNAVEAVDQATSLSPDVVLMDAYLPHISGLETTRILKDRGFPGAIVVLSDDIQEMEATLQSGAVGYLIKNGPADELHEVIQQVLEGEFAFGADVIGTREGMMFALPGMDRFGAGSRFTFNVTEMNSGLGMLPVLIGVFCVSQLIADIVDMDRQTQSAKVSSKGILMSLKDWKDQAVNLLRSSLIGTWIVAPATADAGAVFTGHVAASAADAGGRATGYIGLAAADTRL